MVTYQYSLSELKALKWEKIQNITGNYRYRMGDEVKTLRFFKKGIVNKRHSLTYKNWKLS